MECKIKNDIGTIFITEDVMLKVVGYAALECYGIVAMSSKRAKDGIVEWLGIGNVFFLIAASIRGADVHNRTEACLALFILVDVLKCPVSSGIVITFVVESADSHEHSLLSDVVRPHTNVRA